MNSYEKVMCKMNSYHGPQHACCVNKVGPTGPTGPQGEIGPTGPMGAERVLNGFQVQLQSESVPFLNPNDNIIFNTVLNQSSNHISYNSGTGEFTFLQNGNYYVDWWNVTDGTDGPSIIQFSFQNGVQEINSSTNIVTGQMSGNAFVSITNAPVVFTLKNTTNAVVSLGQPFVHANLTILCLN